MPSEIETLRKILIKVKSPTWWARLSYLDGKWWSDVEKEALRRAFVSEPKLITKITTDPITEEEIGRSK